MSTAINVFLSDATADEQWGKNALTSAGQGELRIHIESDAPCLDKIQKAGRQMGSQGISPPQLAGSGWSLERQWAFAQGFYSPKQRQAPLWNIEEGDYTKQLVNRFIAADWVRVQMNATPEDLSPEKLVRAAASFLQSASDKISYEFIEGSELLKQSYIGTFNVGRGSERPPSVLRLDFNPTSDPNAPISAALVGKGITFDSGGYSMKSSEGMLAMKMDMGGAAYVAGALWYAIKSGLKKRVVMYLCCAENLVSGHAYKLGDVITYPNGTRVEIVNTDAEGRLVLADGLWHATNDSAELIIDAATLTGAAHVAVGNEYNAIFSLDKELIDRALEAAKVESEPHWPLPLNEFHRYKFPSPYADTANSVSVKGGGAGGASNAAGFLSRFVRDGGKGWIHIDLAGAMFSKETAQWSAGGTAMGIRTIARLLLDS